MDAFSMTPAEPPLDAKLLDLNTILQDNPDRCVAVFPECTATNGRGILPFSPSLLTVNEKVKIFPISLRYTPADVTTPVPQSYYSFLWNLCSRPTHCIRVRIAEAMHNAAYLLPEKQRAARRNSYDTNLLDDLHSMRKNDESENGSWASLRDEEQEVLDKVGEALARLGRVKRVGLSTEDKQKFVKVWSKRK